MIRLKMGHVKIENLENYNYDYVHMSGDVVNKHRLARVLGVRTRDIALNHQYQFEGKAHNTKPGYALIVSVR